MPRCSGQPISDFSVVVVYTFLIYIYISILNCRSANHLEREIIGLGRPLLFWLAYLPGHCCLWPYTPQELYSTYLIIACRVAIPGLNILPRFTHILLYYYTFIYLCVLLSVFGFNDIHITYFSVLVVKIVRNLLVGTILLKINLFLAIAGDYTNNERSFGMISAGISTICLFQRTSWLILSSHYF